jgi:hypothetical protein
MPSLKSGTGVKVESKFDYKDSVFSESGFLNYVIRYGGGGGDSGLTSGRSPRGKMATTVVPNPESSFQSEILF